MTASNGKFVVKRNQHARRRPRTREEREMERLEDGQHRESEITEKRLISTVRHPSSHGRNRKDTSQTGGKCSDKGGSCRDPELGYTNFHDNFRRSISATRSRWAAVTSRSRVTSIVAQVARNSLRLRVSRPLHIRCFLRRWSAAARK